MAWQSPKTDWSAEDGVRDSDLNRIEENIRMLFSGQAPYSNIDVYVSKSGSDANGAGTAASPYASITKALSTLPKDFNGKFVNVNIGAGTYNENVAVDYFSGGVLHITGTSGTTVTINSLTVQVSNVLVTNIALSVTGTSGVMIGAGSIFTATSNILIAGATTGLNVFDNSQVFIGTASISNSTTAISVYNNARLFVYSINCTNVDRAMSAANGGVIAYNAFTGNANVAMTTTGSGGRILTGT